HSKHHAAYVNNLNIAREKLAEAEAKEDMATAKSLQSAIHFNGGGHINHSLFWKMLCPKGGGGPSGDLLKAINETYGSVDSMRKQVSALAIGVQGSGWAWLGM